MISKALNRPDLGSPRIRSIALRTIFSPSIPKTVALISLARKKKVHPASWSSRSNAFPSRPLTNLQPHTQDSLSNCRASGKSAPSFIRTVPALIVSAIWVLFVVDPLFLSKRVSQQPRETGLGVTRTVAFPVKIRPNEPCFLRSRNGFAFQTPSVMLE
jgi:hypothetical protein